MKIRTDFVTNSSSSGFVVVKIESKVLIKLFEEAGVPFVLLNGLGDYFGAENGIPGAITDSVALTVCEIIGEILEREIYEWTDGCENLDEDAFTTLVEKIKQNADEIDMEADAVIESGKATSDAGGPDFSYAYLKMKDGKGEYKGFSAYDDYYGDDENPSSLYKWAKERGYYDLANERPGFEGGYDEAFYFYPPYKEMAESYDDVNRIVIDGPVSERKKCLNIIFALSGRRRILDSDELWYYIRSQGGELLENISSKVNYLIENNSNSSTAKVKKAKELGIQIITEEEFIEKFGKPNIRTVG